MKNRFKSIMGIILIFFALIDLIYLLLVLIGSFIVKESLSLSSFTSWFLFLLAGIIFAIFGLKLGNQAIKNLLNRNSSDIHSSGLYYASFWKRLFAVLIDIIILSPILFSWYFIKDINRLIVNIAFWSSSITYIYEIVSLTLFGQTIGKYLMRIKVFKVTGNRISIFNALKREAVVLLFFCLLIVEHINAMMIISNSYISKNSYYSIRQHIGTISPLSSYILFLILIWYFSEIITLLLNRKKRAIHDFIGSTIVLDLQSRQ